MKAVLKAALPALALAAAGCQVNVDENTQARLDNAGEAIEGAAESAGNLAESAAGTVENAADEIGNSVDVTIAPSGESNEADSNSQ